MTVKNVKFCWLCGKKLYGNHSEQITVDFAERTFHKSCAKEIKTGLNFKKDGEGYISMEWVYETD